MTLNATPRAERIHIGIFGRRNAGKSSLINAVTGQNLAIVSEILGTTTDPVPKSMELLPLGPVVITDTPGLDDKGKLGSLRVQKAYQTLNKTDFAVLVIDVSLGMTPEDSSILTQIKEKNIPFLIALNKCDLGSPLPDLPEDIPADRIIPVSALTGMNIQTLKKEIGTQWLRTHSGPSKKLVGDLIRPGDLILLVIPIDKAAPKGRLILPQQQTIRDILDHGAVSVAIRDTELASTLKKLPSPPALVITDSQAFAEVAKIVPPEVPLTSFSILFARYKGDLETVVQGARMLDSLQDHDAVLISEGCTHHRQCGDIGTVKLPQMLRSYTGKSLNFHFTSGTEFPADLSLFRLVIHCGGCMLNEREMQHRLHSAQKQSVPITNYGTAIAHMQGILQRSLHPFYL